MKKCDVFTRCVNLFALSGYLLSIMSLLDHESAPLAKVNGVFHLFFLVFLMTLEIQEPVSPNIKYLGFMTTNFGKSIFYLWLAMTTLSDSVISIIGTSFTGVVAIGYFIASLCSGCCCNKRRNNKKNNTTTTSAAAAPLNEDSPELDEAATPLIVTFPNNGEQHDQETHGESSNSPTLPLYTPPVYTKADYNRQSNYYRDNE